MRKRNNRIGLSLAIVLDGFFLVAPALALINIFLGAFSRQMTAFGTTAFAVLDLPDQLMRSCDRRMHHEPQVAPVMYCTMPGARIVHAARRIIFRATQSVWYMLRTGADTVFGVPVTAMGAGAASSI